MSCVVKPNSGMSLLELTFASGILAMALSLLFGSLISITLVARINEDMAVANIELVNVMESIRTMTLDELKDYEAPPLEKPGTKQAVSLVFYDELGEQVALPLSDDDADKFESPDLPNPLELEATLLWSNEKGHMFRASATTLVGH